MSVNLTKEVLTNAEFSQLQSLELVIERGKKMFVEVGTSLMEIRVKRLYRGEYETFEEYCQSKWGFSRQFANKTIESSGIASDLETMVSISNERTAREFISVPSEDRPAVAEKAKIIAAEKGRDTINSRDVKEAKSKIYSTEPKVTVIEPEPDAEPIVLPDEPEITMIQESAGEWIDSIPLFHELSGVPKRKFEESAKLWHKFETDFKMTARMVRNAQKDIPFQFRSRFMSRQMSSFIVNSPESWLKCKVCDGTGQIPQTGQCAMCSSDGFQITNYR